MDLPEKTHLFEQIHQILWDKIRSGEIVPGQRLKDIEWANRLGVSRTPVREAMRKMQQEGVLMPLAQGGYEVRPTSRRDLIELYRCRAALEALAAEEAAERFDEAMAKQFEDLVARCDGAIVKQAHHRDILLALKARDGPRAARSMRQHVRETVEDLLPTVPDIESQSGEERGAA